MLGKLHNLARAVADEETERNYVKGEDSYPDKKAVFNYDKDGVLGLGLRPLKPATRSPTTGENVHGFDVKDAGKRLFGPLNTKVTTYLSQFILHIAAIGDIVDGTDTTHDFNYFSLVYERPKDVRFLVFILLNKCTFRSPLVWDVNDSGNGEFHFGTIPMFGSRCRCGRMVEKFYSHLALPFR